MCDINYPALTLSEKILIVLFLLVIPATSIYLIFVTVRKNKFTYQPRSMIIISLAIGDTILAIFALAVEAQLIYGSAKIACRTAVTANIYKSYVIHFVYGVGIMFLALEFVIRHKVRRPLLGSHKFLEAFGYSAAPWLLMLIIALPLTMAGADWATCDIPVDSIPSRNRAAISVLVLLPAIAALITCILVLCITLTPIQDVYLSHSAPIQDVNNTPALQRNEVHLVQPGSDFQHKSADNKLQHQQDISQPINAIPSPPSYESVTQNHQTLLHACPQSSYPDSHHNPEFYQPTQQRGPSSDNSAHDTLNPIEEKRILLWLALVHFICIVPQAAFSLSGNLSSSECSFVILAEVFFWLSCLRSILTPQIIMSKPKSYIVRSGSTTGSSCCACLESCSPYLGECFAVSACCVECCQCIASCCKLVSVLCCRRH